MACAADPRLIFLTGDLGYKALEPLREVMGDRFINAGIAEQNMVSVAAGLAREGMKPWCYSIAPFIYARAMEQIRNDVSLHDLPVVLVGNGGGFGYGVMGPTHHATGDYGALLTLPNLRVHIPASDADAGHLIRELVEKPHPAYLRLGLSEFRSESALPPYAPMRKLLDGGGATLLMVGPLAGPTYEAARGMDVAKRPTMWLLTELPIGELGADFLADVRRSKHLVVAEEHVPAGSAGWALASALLARQIAPARFAALTADVAVPHRYGSQSFHRKSCGLDAASILAACDVS